MTRSDLIIINKTDLAPMVGAGLLDGDTFQGKMVFGQNSDVTFLSQSYEKVFCTKGNGVVKKCLYR